MAKYIADRVEEGKYPNGVAAAKLKNLKPDEKLAEELPGIKPGQSRAEAVKSLLDEIKVAEQGKALDIPGEINPGTAEARKTVAETHATVKGILTELILQTDDPGEAAKLLGDFLTATGNKPEVIPPYLGLALAQRFQAIAEPGNPVSLAQLKSMEPFIMTPGLGKVIPGLTEINSALNVKRAGVEKELCKQEEKAIGEAKEKKHIEREKTLEEDTFEGAAKTAEKNLIDGGDISKSTEITMESKSGDKFNTQLNLVMENPVIKKALKDLGVDVDYLNNVDLQLFSLFIIQSSPDLMIEAVKSLSEKATVD